MAVSDWSANADENTSIDGINIAEHCPAKNMNDALRAVMAAVKNECDALQSDLSTCLRIGGGRLTGPLTLEGGESAEGVSSSGTTWIRYKSGLQIYWGYISIPANSVGATRSLPVAFIDANYVCVGSYADIDNVPGVFYVVAPQSSSAVKALAAHSSGRYDWNRPINFLAVGRWK